MIHACNRRLAVLGVAILALGLFSGSAHASVVVRGPTGKVGPNGKVGPTGGVIPQPVDPVELMGGGEVLPGGKSKSECPDATSCNFMQSCMVTCVWTVGCNAPCCRHSTS
jgi:hypothetical protein